MSNVILYFTNFKKNIKTLYIRTNPVFLFLFVFHFLYFNFCQYDLFHQFLQQMYAQKNTCQFLFLHILRFYAVALVFLQKIFFFSIKLIWLNPKSDLNLIASGFDNLICIIIGIAITSLTYIDCSLPLINHALYILYFPICCFVSSFIFSTLYFPLISLSIWSYFYRSIFCSCQKYKIIIELFYLHHHFF